MAALHGSGIGRLEKSAMNDPLAQSPVPQNTSMPLPKYAASAAVSVICASN
jgi:hypothetical protein